MRQFIERLLQSVDPPDPERAERLWAEYRANGPKADTAFATLMAWYGGPIYRRIWGFVRSDAAEKSQADRTSSRRWIGNRRIGDH